jgi:hypothetical protein
VILSLDRAFDDTSVSNATTYADMFLGVDLAAAHDDQAGADDPGIGHLLAEEAAKAGPVLRRLRTERHPECDERQDGEGPSGFEHLGDCRRSRLRASRFGEAGSAVRWLPPWRKDHRL